MKRFYKIFMAVAAVAGVTACTTDATEDLGVNLNEGQTTLTLSLDDTRTQLGVKGEGETTYPLTWAAGDAISVNGSVSNALTAEEAGATTATFTFKNSFGENPTSYFIAYPAVDGVANQVMFAAEQTHTSNTTFGNNAAVMYGYATDLNGVKLNHLTGVLKIGVVSNNIETLKSVRISTVDRKPIAGTFSVDEKGKLTPVNTTDVITYTFSEGVDLTAEPTYIHVAVPAGVYGELYVTLEAETEKAMDDMGMDIQKITAYSYKTVKTDSTKPLNAGTVREFSTNLTFEPANEETDYVIATYDDLKKFKTAVEGGDTRNAVLVNDIEVGDDWASINAATYAATFNGNGYAIKGLKAPLFNATAATIKGVHLKGVNITSAATTDLGALVNKYTGTSVTHCSAEGKIELDAAAVSRVSGLVGYIPQSTNNMTFTDCVNNCNISVNNIAKGVNFGGSLAVLGEDHDSIQGGTFTCYNNLNNGTISINGEGANTYAVCGGGVIGFIGRYKTDVQNCVNSASVTINVKAVEQIRVAGVVGRLYNSKGNNDASFKKCSNSGKISVEGVATTGDGIKLFTIVGGCLGQLENTNKYVTVEDCDNSGNVTITSSANFGTHLDVGGIVAYNYGAITMKDCDNTAETVSATLTNNMKRNIAIGGLLGRSRVNGTAKTSTRFTDTFTDCNNRADVNADIQKTQTKIHIGGAVGWIYGYQNTRFTYKFENVDNYGSVKATLNAVAATEYERVWLGGILGTDYHQNKDNNTTDYNSNTACNNNSNSGNNIFKNCDVVGSADKTLYVGGNKPYYVYAAGIIGYVVFNFTMTDCTCSMPYLYEGKDTSAKYNYYGGITGKVAPKYDSKTTSVNGFTNSGSIVAKLTKENESGFSGVFGYCDSGCSNVTLKMENITNNGDILIESATTDKFAIKYLRIGGLYAQTFNGDDDGFTWTQSFDTLKNFGDITVKNANISNSAYIGGVVGQWTTGTLQNMESNCDIATVNCEGDNIQCGVLAGAKTNENAPKELGTGNSVGGSLNGVTLTEENYYQYVFHGGTAETCSGVTLLAPIVDTPAGE